MKALACLYRGSLLALFAAGVPGCTHTRVECGGTSCPSLIARVALTLPGPVPSGAKVIACHLSACTTAELPATASGTFSVSSQPDVVGGLSGGTQPQLTVQWLDAAPASGDTYSVTVKDPSGTTLAQAEETATYMSQIQGGSCGPPCQTIVMTPSVPSQITCRPAAPCPTDWLPYADRACSPPNPNDPSPCSNNGDNLCYLPCSSDLDCRAAGLTSCGSITFFHGSDVGTQVHVCNGTAQLPMCAAPDAGTDGGRQPGTDGGRDAGGGASFFCFRSATAPADGGDVACTVGESYCVLSKDKTMTQTYAGGCATFKASPTCSTLKPTCDCVPESSYVNCTCGGTGGAIVVTCAQI